MFHKQCCHLGPALIAGLHERVQHAGNVYRPTLGQQPYRLLRAAQLQYQRRQLPRLRCSAAQPVLQTGQQGLELTQGNDTRLSVGKGLGMGPVRPCGGQPTVTNTKAGCTDSDINSKHTLARP